MAEERDMLDDLIDIQEDWQALSNPFGGVLDTLTQDPSKVKVWDPSEYKEVPRTNAVTCLQVAAQTDEVCGLCQQVCPTAAIEISPIKKRVIITEDCRRCGLCSGVCPTGTFLTTKLAAKVLYDRIARVAAAYEQAIITCTRALGRLPKGNEIVLPCVGAVPTQVWFALLSEYGNLTVYLPLGICDRCRTITGEEAYADHIAEAEELSDASVGLEVDEKDLTHDYTRAYKRSQFVGNMARAGMTVATAGVPVLAGAQIVAKRIKDHGQQLLDLQRQIEKAVGAKTDGSKRRVLTQERKLVLAAIQKQPELANNFSLRVPVCDWSLCTMCGDCTRACPVHACEIDSSGHFSVEPTYCINCEACMIVCPECAIEMEPCDPQELVVPDENAEKLAVRRAALEQRKQEARARAKKALDAVEHLAET
ncbi:MAG: 4Fe-4S binding protein [Atopobiaceae bacterium]|nr:4Fe-4S binding protein [Atopobiaceae bacterium]